MTAKVRCRCGQELQLKAGQSQVVCPGCQRRLRVSERQHSRDVFLSYSSQDKAAAEAACAILEQRGIRCWMAPRDIVPGTEWSAAIIDGIEQCRLMVLLYSQHSNQSPQVLREVERAVAKGMSIIPLRLDSITLSKGLEYFISSQHWLDALTPPLEQHLDKLATTITGLLKLPNVARKPIDATSESNSQALEASSVRGGWPGRRTLMVAIAAVTLLAVSSPLVYGLLFPPAETTITPLPPDPPPGQGDERDAAYVSEYRHRFALLDANSDGYLTGVEYLQLARDNNIPIQFGAGRFRSLDTNADDQLTVDEFLRTSDNWVADLDQDHSGTVSVKEYQQIPPFRKKSDGAKTAREILEKFDVNRDGQLDVREVERLILVRPGGN